jgi:hypothetical protein
MRVALPALALLTIALAACNAPAPESPAKPATSSAAVDTTAADAKFADLSKRWLDGWMRLNPVSATQLGDHRFDREVDDLSAAGRQHAVDFND